MTGGAPHPTGCISCHIYPERDGLLANILNEDYLCPINATLGPNDSKLYVIAQEANLLVQVDLQNNNSLSHLRVGMRPHSIVLTTDNNIALVSNQWANNIYFIDLNKWEVIDSVMVGGGPAGMDISEDGKILYVANTYSNNISLVDIQKRKEIKRLHGGNFPTGVATTPQGDFVYVSSQRTVPIAFREEPQTEVTVLKTANQRVSQRAYFNSAHIMENIAVTPSGDMVLATLIRPKNNVPSMQIEKGWMMNHGIGIIQADGSSVQLLLDEPNAFYPDPYDVVIHPDGKVAYVSHSGADIVSVLDLDKIRKLLADADEEELKQFGRHLGLSSEFVITRVRTGANPKGMTISSNGRFLFVTERMDDKVSMIHTQTNSVVNSIDLGGPDRITYTRIGGQLFNNAGHTFHNQYSCYTCHPDGHEDGLTYDLTGSGRNLANVQTLRDLHGTAPFKWVGTNQSVYKQCGMRFSKFVTRTESFSPKDLDAVVAYIMRELTHPPNLHRPEGAGLTEAQIRGKALYERSTTNDGRAIPEKHRCTTCHNGPNYSNYQLADVGSLKPNDDPTLFDAPNLNNVYESAPYLHDGSAATLEEIWTIYNDDDTHGYVNDMTKDQLNDLIEYLKSLSAERYFYSNIKLETKKGQL